MFAGIIRDKTIDDKLMSLSSFKLDKHAISLVGLKLWVLFNLD